MKYLTVSSCFLSISRISNKFHSLLPKPDGIEKGEWMYLLVAKDDRVSLLR